MNKSNFEQTIKYFDKIDIDETNFWIYGDMAVVKINIGDYSGALKDFDKVLKLEPK